jgi:hypothetical protein
VAHVVATQPPGWIRRPELAEGIADALAVALGTAERRRAVRTAVVELTETVRADLPLFAGELDRALAEPVSEDADGDLVWVAAVMRSFGRE